MRTAKVFRSGNSQAVRLPKDFQFQDDEVLIFREGEDVVLRRKPRDLTKIVEILRRLPDDFLADGIDDPPSQERKGL